MTEKQCRLFETCEAPLCPLDNDSLKHGLWYADEGICRARRFQSLPWIQKQKGIAKLELSVDDGFFTVRMLDSAKTVTKSLRGADPNTPKAEEKWLRQREEKRAKVSQKRRNNKAAK